MKTQLVVVGGGPGGYAAAFLAADLGMEVTVVDMEERLGGVCLLRGCIPSKALLHVAKAMGEARHLAEWGVSYQSPELDLDAMRDRKNQVVRTLTDGLGQLAKKRKVRVVRARATFEGSQTLRLHAVGDAQPEDDTLEFEHCILATGSSPLQVPSLQVDSDRLMDSTVALDLPEIPDSLLVIGGGYIGLEMGTVYAALGTKVSVVELTGGLLPGADRNLVKPLHKRLEKKFEAIYLNTKVTGLSAKRKAIEVTFEGEEAPDAQPFGRVLVSVGRRPNSSNLGLENTRVEIDDQGFVTVDRQQRTADPHILAIGDVAGQPMLAHKAAHEGKVAVEALAGESAEFAPRAIPAVVFTDPEVAWAGLTENEAEEQGTPFETALFPWAASGRAQAVGQTDGLTKWLLDPESQRVIGCGIVGTGAGDLISEAVLAIETGAHVRDVAESIHPHPTLGETLGFAAEVPLGIATDVYRPPRNRKK
jgi:dihydrolipoamide dehydrogenase